MAERADLHWKLALREAAWPWHTIGSGDLREKTWRVGQWEEVEVDRNARGDIVLGAASPEFSAIEKLTGEKEMMNIVINVK